MGDYLIGILSVPLLLLGWLTVQSLARLYARAHPDLGPYREEGGGCGAGCHCDGGCKAKRDRP
jgi:hypothetical protein